MSRANELTAILANEYFREAVKATEDQLTRKVMGLRVSEEDRQAAFHQYHALHALLATMRAMATKEAET